MLAIEEPVIVVLAAGQLIPALTLGSAVILRLSKIMLRVSRHDAELIFAVMNKCWTEEI
jgi:hypothetical protein